MRTFGAAWAMMGVALGFHIIDEAATDFLASYNPIATRIRSHLRGIPFPPVFTFWPWFLSLLAATAILLGLTPLAYARATWMVPVAIVVSLINIGNGLLHIVAAIRVRHRVPGLISAPFLLATALWLLYSALRTT
jgi:hypothetical protein